MLPSTRLSFGRAFVVLTAAVMLAGVSPARAEESRFASFGGHSEAAAVVFKVTYSGFASLFPIVDQSLGHVSATVDSRPNARGYAAAADPGQAIQSLGAVGVPAPAYPLMARAEAPGATPRSRTSAAEQAVGPGTASGLVSEVVAAEGPAVDAVATAASFDAPGVVTTGTASARTSLAVAGVVRGRTEVVVNDIVIAGVLRIGAVHTIVDSSAGGTTGSATGEPRIEISGVSLAGQPASIDERGVHLVGQEVPGSLGGAVAPVVDPLGAAGVRVRLGAVELTTSPDGTSAVAGAAGLFVAFTAPDGSVVEYRIGWAAQTLGAALPDLAPLMSDTLPGFPVSVTPEAPVLPIAVAQPAPVAVAVSRTRPVRNVATALPAGMVLLVGLGQLAFLAAMAIASMGARGEAPRKEWLFDTIDRLRPVDAG